MTDLEEILLGTIHKRRRRAKGGWGRPKVDESRQEGEGGDFGKVDVGACALKCEKIALTLQAI